MQRIVGGIEIENDLFRGLLVGVEEEVDDQTFDGRRIVAHLLVSRRPGAAQFQPVHGRFARRRAQSDRCASNLPASTASTGSCRSS
jgi:hypothetical protein